MEGFVEHREGLQIHSTCNEKEAMEGSKQGMT